MTMLRTIGIGLAVFFAGASARADEISDEEAECRGKSVGAACSGGTCQESECSRIDYSGEKPQSVKRSCMKCVAGAAKEPTPAKTEAPTKTDTPAKADAPAKADTPAKVEPAPTKSSCAVEPGPLSLGTIPLGVVLVALARRRRR